MRPSFLENYLKKQREISTGQMGEVDTKRKYRATQNGRNLGFPEWKRGDIQQTTNIY